MSNKRVISRIALALAGGVLLAIVIAQAVDTFIGHNELALVSTSDQPFSGPFALTATDGKRVTDATFVGRAHAVFFGFTHCPDVCPTTLQRLTVLMEQMGSAADRFVPVFIAIDWERDTPAALSKYLESFDARIVGLTGTEQEILAAAKAFKAYVRRVAGQNGDYSMEHTARIMLIGPEGRLKGTIGLKDDDEIVLKKLQHLTRFQ